MSLPLLLLPLLLSSFHSPVSAASNPQLRTLSTKPQHHNPKLPRNPFSLASSKCYHMGPVLSSSPINLHLIWYDKWEKPQQDVIRDFLNSISPTTSPTASPSVTEWWSTVLGGQGL